MDGTSESRMSAKIIPMPIPPEHELGLPSDEEWDWIHYCAAARKAQETMALEDGIAAGKLWAAWLRRFVEDVA